MMCLYGEVNSLSRIQYYDICDILCNINVTLLFMRRGFTPIKAKIEGVLAGCCWASEAKRRMLEFEYVH